MIKLAAQMGYDGDGPVADGKILAFLLQAGKS